MTQAARKRTETPAEKTERLELELDRVERRESDVPNIGPEDCTEVVRLACARASRIGSESRANVYRLSRAMTTAARGFRAPRVGGTDRVALRRRR
jgi:hypothetical protein